MICGALVNNNSKGVALAHEFTPVAIEYLLKHTIT